MEVAPAVGMSYTLVLGALMTVLVVIGGISALVWWVRRPVAHLRGRTQEPLPLFSHSRAAVWVREDEDEADGTTGELIASRTDQNGRKGGTVPSWSVPLPDATAPSSRRSSWQSPATGARETPAPQARPYDRSERSTEVPPFASPASPAAAPGHVEPSVQFSVPTDATLQFLPGRLDILSGSEQGREIRFVRLPGDSETCITFGRRAGTPYRHVQLRDATVSREHAEIRLRGGSWRLLNLSSTNPVQVNGVELATREELELHDGDRVEMGEVTFRFRR